MMLKLLAILCVLATGVSLLDAARRRIRLWCDDLNGILAQQGNTSLIIEFVRFVKQCLLAWALTEAISGTVKVVVIVVCGLMAVTSLYSLWHNKAMLRLLREYQR